MPATTRPTDLRRDHITVDGLDLALVDRGPRDADTLLLLHGYFGSARTWQHLIEPLAAEHRVVAPDWPGWGASQRSARHAYDYDTEVARIVELLDTLDLDAVDLIAHDYGAHLALGLCLRHPHRVKRLVLLNSRAQRSFVARWWLLFAAMGMIGRLPRVGAMAYHALPIRTLHRRGVRREIANGTFDAATVAEYGDWIGTHPQGRAYLARFFADYQVATRRDLLAQLGDIACPTAIVWGEEDPFVPAGTPDELARHIPQATLRRLAGAGHFIAEERPDEVLEVIHDLLARPAR